MSILRRLRRFLSVFAREMPVADRDAIEGDGFAAAAGRLWLGAEVKSDRLPGVAALSLQTEARGRLVAAMDHAIFATRIARDAVNHAVFVPFHFLEQLLVARVVRVGH